MITVTILKNQDIYKVFDCNGHAAYADSGQDIVCAGVSALVINTINAIENLTDNAVDAESNEETGEIIFRFLTAPNEAGKLLMDALVLGLEGIQDNYGSRYMLLNIKEV